MSDSYSVSQILKSFCRSVLKWWFPVTLIYEFPSTVVKQLLNYLVERKGYNERLNYRWRNRVGERQAPPPPKRLNTLKMIYKYCT